VDEVLQFDFGLFEEVFIPLISSFVVLGQTTVHFLPPPGCIVKGSF